MKFDNKTLKLAVKEWIKNSVKAEEKYGHISNWDTSNVTKMSALFAYAEDFNEDISSWDVSNVTEMIAMFLGANSFNQDLSNWNVINVKNFNGIFNETNMPSRLQLKGFDGEDIPLWVSEYFKLFK